MPRRYYVLWVLAMGLVEAGAAFDVSFHFGHLFDEFSIPHLTVAVGVITMVTLLLWALLPDIRTQAKRFTGESVITRLASTALRYQRSSVAGLERKALLVCAGALAFGIAMEPLDLLWHLTFGIDITMWSPTHLLLNYPADIINICVITAFLASSSARAAWAWLIPFFVGLRNVLTMHFALYQQEFGSVAKDSLVRIGKVPWLVQPELLALAGPRAEALVTGGVPDWLYLIYSAFAIGYALAVCATFLYPGGRARTADRWPVPFGVATALAVCFIIWRLIFLGIFHTFHMAFGALPLYFIPMGIVIDLGLVYGPALVRRAAGGRETLLGMEPRLVAAGVTGILAAITLFAGIEVMRAIGVVVPPAPPLALIFACVTGEAGVVFGVWLGGWLRERTDATQAGRALAA
ncbi:MAG TPA: hypothetical protein VF807_10010, partial [Ktedonobacterales bacterium]